MIALRKPVLVLIIILVVSSIPIVVAQISFGTPAYQISVEATISTNGDIHVEHLVKNNLNQVIQIDTISGTVLNLEVKDVNGKDVQHAVIGNNVGVTIFPTRENILVKYDLKDVLFLKNGVWKWSLVYPESTTFFFPKGVDLVFVEGRPVHIKNGGMKCHGCQMNLEYIINEPTILNEVEWEGKKFPVLIRTLDEINSLNFDQPTRRISFETSQDKSFVTLIIPLELLWNPYQVYLEGEKILKHEFSQNSTHVWLNVRPATAGTLEIIGTSVIPEFPIMIPLVVGMAIILGFQFKNKINLR